MFGFRVWGRGVRFEDFSTAVTKPEFGAERGFEVV